MSEEYAPSGRVVITGIGAVTPLGIGVEQFWSNCLAGVNGVEPMTLLDPAPYTTRVGG